MIPRKIHYCWLSGNKKPTVMVRCMKSWHRVMDDYEFVLWDMQKAKTIDSMWLKKAVANRQWAFAADYIRLWALYNEGGVYLDADVEIVRDFSPLLNRELLLGEECGSGKIEAAVMGAAPGNGLIKKVLDSFEDTPACETLPERLFRVIGNDVSLLPSCVFSPKNWKSGKLYLTSDTYAIHHFAGTWLSTRERLAQRMGRLFGSWAIPCARWLINRF